LKETVGAQRIVEALETIAWSHLQLKDNPKHNTRAPMIADESEKRDNSSSSTTSSLNTHVGESNDRALLSSLPATETLFGLSQMKWNEMANTKKQAKEATEVESDDDDEEKEEAKLEDFEKALYQILTFREATKGVSREERMDLAEKMLLNFSRQFGADDDDDDEEEDEENGDHENNDGAQDKNGNNINSSNNGNSKKFPTKKQ
jgi:hypothetical protein